MPFAFAKIQSLRNSLEKPLALGLLHPQDPVAVTTEKSMALGILHPQYPAAVTTEKP